MTQDTSHNIIRQRGITPRLLRYTFILLLMFLGANKALAQTTDYTGIYYIASGNTAGKNNVADIKYSRETPASNYYLCPTDETSWICYVQQDDYTNPASDNDQPFLTTYKYRATQDPSPAIWIIKKVPETEYYHIIHYNTSRYLTYNGPIRTTSGSGTNRIRFHLQSTPTDSSLFQFNPDADLQNTVYRSDSAVNIVAVAAVGVYYYNNNNCKYLNLSSADNNSLVGTGGKTDGPTGYKNVGATIGIWNDPGRSSEWFLEDGRFLAPTISAVDPDDNTISVTDNNNFPAGYNIRYTISTNGSAPDDPTATSPIMTNGVYLVSEACIIKAVIERDGIVLTKVATSGTLEPTTVDDPTFEVNCDNKLEIHATIPSAHIYYTKANGTAPADPSNGQGSTRFTAPITLNAGDIVKAIAYNQTETLNSGVSTYTYSEADIHSEAPTITFSGTTVTISYNGSATIYYTKTEDGTEPGIPTAESQNGSSPLAITIDPTKETRIRAKAKSGNFKISCDYAEYIIPAPPTITISSDGDNVASPHCNKLSITGGADVTFWYIITSGSVTEAPNPATATYTQWTADSYIDLDSYVASNQATCKVFAYATNNSGDRSTIVGSESHNMKTSGKPTLTPPAGSDPTLVISNGEVGDNVIIDNETPADATDDVILPVTFGGTAEYSIPYEATGTLTVSFKHGDWLQSYSETYTIPGAPATPTYSQDVYNHLSLYCATDMAIIHYTIDGSEPTLQSPTYTAGCLNNIAPGTTVRAKSFYGFRASAEMKDVNNSANYYVYQHDYSDPPQFHVEGDNVVISVPGHTDATIYYTYNTSNNNTDIPSAPNDATRFDNVYGDDAPLYDNQKGNIVLPGITIFSAIAEYDGLLPSYPVQILTREGYSVNSASELLDKLSTYNSSYIFILSDIDNASSFSTVQTFTGVIEGNGHTITGLTQPLIGTANGAVIHDLYLDDVSINITTANTNVGAIAQNATGSARIYNCGILNTGSTELANSSTISGTQYVGGIVGYIDGNARIINCFSYADINGGTHRGGIVGYNNVATISNTVATGTMVMNCMFYGDISTTGSPTQIAPIYGGEIITNAWTGNNNTGLNNYNYFRFNKPYVSSITTFNCALGAQDRYLERFEFYRMTLNSTRDLAAWYVSGDPKATSLIAKWVLDKKIAPYPILKDPGYYPSIFNPDAKNATPIDANNEHRNEGRKLGTLTVNIQLGSGGAQFNNASASLKAGKSTLTLNITDKDYDNYNFNYKKVQLPYYNEVGEGNYTNNRVVTGWKIVGINGSNSGTGGYSTGVDVVFDGNGGITSTPYNFVDRASTNKDLYSVSGRVFNQGAYWEVPDGVTSITIEPYWAKAAYLSDPTYDITYQADKLTEKEVSAIGHSRPTTLDPDGQTINTTFAAALSELDASDADDTHTVYDYAIVLVGNYHKSFGENSLTGNNIKPVTIMSADFDHDCEPDYTFFYQHTQRVVVAPLRFDFISIPGIGMMQKATGSYYNPEPGIFRPKHWFEITNTVLIHFNQFEYADNEAQRVSSPLILQGGIYEQFISTRTQVAMNTQYLLIGGNAWFKTFANGCHTSVSKNTPKVPISVAGGDYDRFYLSGIYRPQWDGNTDNAECYIDGGRFGEVAGAGMELIGKNKSGGNVTWIINAADIDEFYGGGINDAKPVQGNIYTEISNSYVRQFCGGPKFGNMNENKTVTTKATNCYFGDFYGAGYGGTSIFQLAYEDITTGIKNISPDVSTERWNEWATGTGPDNAHYIRDYETTHHSNVSTGSEETPNAISVGYDYEYFYFSGGANSNKGFKVARFYVNYATLSLATTQNVYSTLTGCKLIKDWADPSDPNNINKYSKGNLFGGGDRGFVTHDVETTISNCTVDGNVYGAGYQAEAPTVDVMRTTGFQIAPEYNNDAGVFNDEQVKTALTDSYTWTSANSVSSGNAFDDTNHLIYTTVELDHLGTVGGNATLTIKGNTRVAGNVFGGGDLSSVGTSTTVAIQDQTSISGDLFGGGNEADVMGNTSVTMSAGNVLGSVYGGGNYGSVGTYYYESAQYDESKPGENNGAAGKPLTCKNNTGTSTVIIEGSSEVGPLQPMSMKASGGPDDKGHVFGASKGMIDDISGGDKNYVLYMAYVNNTSVTVRGNALVRGSVYGGSENGHVLHDTYVYIQGGQIGCGDGLGTRYADNKFVDPTVTPVTTINALGECASWDYEAPYSPYDPFAKYQNTGDNKYYYDDGFTYYAENGASTATDGHTYYGNVFGGGSGSIPYWDATNHQSVYLSSSGFVEGDTHVIISGGHILTNVYGGCEATNVLGTTNVTMTGGTVGVPRTEQQIKAHPLTGYLFGGGKGDQRIFFNKETNVKDANVSVSGGIIYSSVFGGGEDGHVLRNATVTISGNTIIGTAGTTYVDGNVFGAGRGFGGDALTAGNVGGSVELNIQGGTMLGSVYGGGRLASVGYGLYLSTGAEAANYGVMRADNEYNDPGFDFTSSFFNEKGRGHITINISGGTIGKQFNSDVDGAEHSGNVFGGSMGRLTKLDGTTTNTLWPKLATAKSTTVNISQTSNSNPTIIRRSVYGGGELGTVTTNSAVSVSGGTIQGSVFGGGYGSDDDTKSFTESATTYSPIELAGKINGNTVVNLTGGIVSDDVYGGGALASVGGNTIVNLFSGAIYGDAYGGGLGQIGRAASQGVTAITPVAAIVGGNVTVNLGDPNEAEDVDAIATAFTTNPAEGGVNHTHTTSATIDQTTYTGIQTAGRIFGCNNQNGTPKGTVTINVYRTYHGQNDKPGKTAFDVGEGTYEVAAVYGGGNLATYDPTNPETKTQVNIYGCGLTSIKYVYGGGNAAPVPASEVNVEGTYEIYRVFGGGNGKDPINKYGGANNWELNPGADVGIKPYTGSNWNNESQATKALLYADLNGDKGTNTETGQNIYIKYADNSDENSIIGTTKVTVLGGTIHDVFGGSNTKGDIVKKTNVKVGDELLSTCPLNVGGVYGGSNEAYISGETDLDLSCTEGTQEIFGGSHDADVEQNVHLKINSGHYERVFGGNNNSGSIKGSITVTIEENGCLPIEIDELYGGGYLAAYSIYGYDDNGNYRTSAPDGFTPYADPQINVISATRIGKIFGGGYGESAVMVGNPHVNINMENGTIDGRYRYNQQKSDPRYNSGDANYSYTELDGTTPLVLSAQGEGGFESPKQIPLGTIGDIFGGGNDAKVIGNTYVEIGTGQWLNNGVVETLTRNEAQISGAVYGGGNNADVTNTNVEIANGQIQKNVYGGGYLGDVGIINKTDIRQYTWTNNTGICYVNITGGTIGPDNVNDLSIDKGNVFGGGEGIANTFWCEKGMAYSTTVNISNGTVKRNVYGGGKIARVESNTAVTIGTANETGNSYAPTIKGNVFGAGAGTDTHGYSALVRGNSTVTIQGIAKVEQNVYGGGEEASTGKYQLVTEENKDQHPGLEVGMPYSLVSDGLGITTVTIQDNATILGNIFGAGKGHEPNYTAFGNNRSKRMMTYDSQLYPDNTEGTSWDYYEDPTYVWEYFTTLPKYLTYIETLGLVTQTNVTIGENASVNESVYGGSENGFVQHNTNVTIQGNTSIGNDIFGGGLGLATYAEAGRVNGNTNVTINGGFIKHNVYGGGELGSVGTVIEKTPHNTEGPATDNSLYNFELSWPVEFKYKDGTGKATVSISGTTRLGTNGDDNGDVFGGGKGDVSVNWTALKANTTRWESLGANDNERTINYLARYRSVDEAEFANVKETDVTVDLPFTGNIDDIIQPLYVKDNDGGSKWKLIIDATYDGSGDNDTYTFTNNVPCITGSVYGGAENGHVNGDTKLTLVDGIVGHGLYGGGKGKGQYQGWLYDAKIAGSPTVKDYSAFNTAIGGVEDYYKTVDGLLGEQIYSITAGKVYGNTKVIMNDGYVLRNIFGGGNLGSVGKGNYAGGADDYSHSGYGERPDVDESNDQQANLWTVSNGFSPTSAITSSNTPTTLADHFMSSGKTDILIKGGQVGYILPSNTTLSDQNSDNVLNRTKAAKLASKDDLPTGNVFGGCRGQASTTNAQSPRYLYIPDYFLGFVNETNIQIGDGTGTGPTILGSVYGGGQDGHVRRSTKVTVNNAYIGIPYENTNNGTYTTILGNDLSNAQWKNRGNVFGAGSGIGTFNKTDQNGVPLDDPDSNDPEDYLVDYNFASGSVTCNTDITIGNGAVIYQNVYGGGSLASIGPPKIPPLVDDEQKEATGNNPSHLSTSYTKVTIDGGTVGDNGSYAAGYGGDVYGGSRGNYDGQLNLGDAASSYATTIWTEVWAKNGTIKGNVFGGGQSGAVKQATKVTIGNNTIVTPAQLRSTPAGSLNQSTQSEQRTVTTGSSTTGATAIGNAATESTGARNITTNRVTQ